MGEIDVNRLRLKSVPIARPQRVFNPTARRKRPFLKGPVPLNWLCIASKHGGKALQVGIAIWYLKGLKKTRTIKLTGSVLKEFSVSRNSGYRALIYLEKAGLVQVERHPGRSPIVTVIDAPDLQQGNQE